MKVVVVDGGGVVVYLAFRVVVAGVAGDGQMYVPDHDAEEVHVRELAL